jgi:hypothetical protein
MKPYEMLGISRDELEVYFTDCVLQAKGRAQDTVPIDTGNMRYHAFKNRKTGYFSHRVYFDLGGQEVTRYYKKQDRVVSFTRDHKEGKLDGIAPYAKWTNERPCRVQGWFDNKTVQTFTEELAMAVAMMLVYAGISVDSVDIIQKEEETDWNTSNT